MSLKFGLDHYLYLWHLHLWETICEGNFDCVEALCEGKDADLDAGDEVLGCAVRTFVCALCGVKELVACFVDLTGDLLEDWHVISPWYVSAPLGGVAACGAVAKCGALSSYMRTLLRTAK